MTELCYFLTCLKANYHNVEYHNYSHALSHAQSMYWILKKTPGVFTELEMCRISKRVLAPVRGCSNGGVTLWPISEDGL
ncbi:hypothetical protein AVEN_9501-1 [Araneus ventricosus]|uniref:PDEase domain-containing protein n=1 Tax=Araneus ventricosus TaxID=182803 RepID=A0A4Y2TWI9_ARAVE|nr:hypothetical protein AVEN_9501-1 [Araneus ventricosus]